MKILFLNGAARRNGTTEGAINHSIKYIHNNFKNITTEVVYFCEEKIEYCNSCYRCDKDESCYIDDSVKSIVHKMIDSDIIIYAFPVYAFGLSTLMQAFLERAGVGFLRFKRPLKDKISGTIITGRRYSHEVAWGQISLNIILNKMILIGSGFYPFIKNDGKNLKSTIKDEEGIQSLEGMFERIFEYLKISSSKDY